MILILYWLGEYWVFCLKEIDYMLILLFVILIYECLKVVLKKKKNIKCFLNGIEEFKKCVVENYVIYLK